MKYVRNVLSVGIKIFSELHVWNFEFHFYLIYWKIFLLFSVCSPIFLYFASIHNKNTAQSYFNSKKNIFLFLRKKDKLIDNNHGC